MDISIGVPQGTVLGPLLFIIYINDIFDICPQLYAYADDTVLINIENDWNELEIAANRNLAKLIKWFLENKSTINLKKTEFLTFGCYVDSVPQHIKININNIRISRNESFNTLD